MISMPVSNNLMTECETAGCVLLCNLKPVPNVGLLFNLIGLKKTSCEPRRNIHRIQLGASRNRDIYGGIYRCHDVYFLRRI